MNTNYKLIHELIDQVADFHKENENGNLQNFAAWLSSKVEKEEIIEVIQIPTYNDPTMAIESALTEFITYLYRYAKIYVKKVIEENNSAFVTYDDVVYILILFFNPEKMTKTELIERNIHEKPTGMEILKRLLKNGLIEQYINEEDKRSKYLKVTEKGKNEFMRLFSQMQQISQLVAGNLTKWEKEHLYFLLKKLDDFHNPIFLNEKGKSMEEILKKLM